jgi:hypothetical protein
MDCKRGWTSEKLVYKVRKVFKVFKVFKVLKVFNVERLPVYFKNAFHQCIAEGETQAGEFARVFCCSYCISNSWQGANWE